MNKNKKIALYQATINNDIPTLKNMSECFNVRFRKGNTILHMAAQKNCSGETTELLIDHMNADLVNALNDYQETALIRGATFGSLQVVEKLACNQCTDININAKNYEGRTALMKAASENNLGVVKCLIANNADVNASDRINENTALHFASEMGHFDHVKHLVCNNANVLARNRMGESARDLARKWQFPDISQYLQQLEQGTPASCEGISMTASID